MQTLLHINCSPRRETSVTRIMSATFVETWLGQHPNGKVIERDLALNPPSHYSAGMLVPSNKPRKEYSDADQAAMNESDGLIGELIEATHIVAGIPMYNFLVPSTFKAWIDQIVIAPKAFAYDPSNFDGSLVGPTGFQGLLTGKKMAVLTSRGCDYRLPQNQRFDHLEAYLRVVFEYIGITDMHFINAQAMVFSPPGVADAALVDYQQEIVELVKKVFGGRSSLGSLKL